MVHGRNGFRLERFYVVGALVTSCLLTIPPYAAGTYGYAFSYRFLLSRAEPVYIAGILIWVSAGTPIVMHRRDWLGR